MNELAFVIKKVISFFVEPLGLVMLGLLVSLVLLQLKKYNYSKILLSISLVLLFLFSFASFSNILVKNLENQYPKYAYDLNVTYIHVLGGGHNTDLKQPISSQLSSASTKRVLEGIIIHNRMKDSKIIFTGYEGDTNTSTAEMHARLALALGVLQENMLINGEPKDTKEEALFTKIIVGEKPFVLVTSASHMPRAMMLFENLGMHPIAAPTDYQQNNKSFFDEPSISSLHTSQVAIHEYLGILWTKMR